MNFDFDFMYVSKYQRGPPRGGGGVPVPLK